MGHRQWAQSTGREGVRRVGGLESRNQDRIIESRNRDRIIAVGGSSEVRKRRVRIEWWGVRGDGGGVVRRLMYKEEGD